MIITIHQPRPDILRLMDRMLLLSGNGQVRRPWSGMVRHTNAVHVWQWLDEPCLLMLLLFGNDLVH